MRVSQCMLFKTVVPVFLVVHVCRTVDRVVGHPLRASVYRGCPCRDRRALMPKVGSRQSAHPLRLLECGLVNVLWWSSKQGRRDCTLLLLHVFRTSCLTTILDAWSLERENACLTTRQGATTLAARAWPLRSRRVHQTTSISEVLSSLQVLSRQTLPDQVLSFTDKPRI